MNYLDLAMDAALSLGTEYADIRIKRPPISGLMRNLSLKMLIFASSMYHPSSKTELGALPTTMSSLKKP